MTTGLPQNLQRQIFLEEMGQLHVPGWEIEKGDDLLALKSPVGAPIIDFVFGNPSQTSFEKAKEFFHGKRFTWLVSKGQNAQLLSDLGFTGPDITFEMVLDLKKYTHREIPPTIEIKKVLSPAEFDIWVSVAAEWLQLDRSLVNQFFSAWMTTGRYTAFLGYIRGIPAATSLVGCSSCGAAVYCIGTLPSFRRQGLGEAVTQACLETAIAQKMPYAVLHGSNMGRPMYEKLGFQVAQIIHEYSYENEL